MGKAPQAATCPCVHAVGGTKTTCTKGFFKGSCLPAEWDRAITIYGASAGAVAGATALHAEACAYPTGEGQHAYTRWPAIHFRICEAIF